MKITQQTIDKAMETYNGEIIKLPDEVVYFVPWIRLDTEKRREGLEATERIAYARERWEVCE